MSTSLDEIVRSLEMNDGVAAAWLQLGETLSFDIVTIRGASYNQQQCYVRALEIDEENADAWTILGTTLSDTATVTVSGVAYTEQQCLVRAGSMRVL